MTTSSETDFKSKLSDETKKHSKSVESQKKGVEYLKERRVGIQEKKGDVRAIIRKWLVNTERIQEHIDRDPKNLERIKRYFHKQFIPTFENFPREEYERVHRRAAQEMGHGADYKVTDEEIRIAISEQKKSLDTWVEFFSSKDSDVFPTWAKYWAFTGVTKMSGKVEIDAESSEISFPKRERKTISGFPELNQEALALSIQHITSLVEKGEKLDEELKKESFNEVYSFYLNKLRQQAEAEKTETEGEWVRFPREDEDAAIRMSKSFQGKNTGWCIAGEDVAKSYGKAGDFYVYYTKDKKGQSTNPRMCIRMQGKQIAEIRGVASNQNLDPVMTESGILDEKLKEFGSEGEKYSQRSYNTRRLTEIYNKLLKNKEYNLNEEEITFMSKKIEGFGQQNFEDSRADEIREFIKIRRRYGVTKIDIQTIEAAALDGSISTFIVFINFIDADLHPQIAEKLIMTSAGFTLVNNIDKFSSIDHNYISQKLIQSGQGKAVAFNLGKFKGVNHEQIINLLVETGQTQELVDHMQNFESLDRAKIFKKIIDAGQTKVLAKNLKKFDLFVTPDIINILLEKGHYEELTQSEYIRNFSKETQSLILDKLFQLNKSELIIEKLATFSKIENTKLELLCDEISIKLAESGNVEFIAKNSHFFRRINIIAIKKLIEDGYFSFVASIPKERISGVSEEELNSMITELIYSLSKKDVFVTTELIVNFPNLKLSKDLLLELIPQSYGLRAFNGKPTNLENFENVDREVFDKLVEAQAFDVISRFPESFKGVSAEEVFDTLFKVDEIYVLFNLESIPTKYHNFIVEKLLENEKYDLVKQYLVNFRGLSLDVAKKLSKFMTIEEIKAHPKSFDNFDEILKELNK